jgi:hypothetical protein
MYRFFSKKVGLRFYETLFSWIFDKLCDQGLAILTIVYNALLYGLFEKLMDGKKIKIMNA